MTVTFGNTGGPSRHVKVVILKNKLAVVLAVNFFDDFSAVYHPNIRKFVSFELSNTWLQLHLYALGFTRFRSSHNGTAVRPPTTPEA